MFINSHLRNPHGLTDVIITPVSFVADMRPVNIFVFKVEKTFNLSCLPKDGENVFKIREIVQLGVKSFA